MGVDLLPWKLPCKLVGVDLLPLKLVETSTEAMKVYTVGGSRSFHFFHQLQLSTNMFRGSFHQLPYIPLHTSTHFHEYHNFPAASTRLP